jgi:protein ImuB
MLWLCIHLPRLSAEVISRGGSVREPFAVIIGEGTRQVVAAASPEAEAAGLRPGMGLGAANALAPGLSVFRRDDAAEAAALTRIAAWAGRFTPVVSLAPPREALLEVAGSARLFGGLEGLMGQAGEGIRAIGYTAFLAMAPTPLGAALLARARPGAQVTGTAELERELASVPLDALELLPETYDALKGLGVRRFGDCLALPRAGLSRRFGDALPLFFDRALGALPDPRERFALPPRFDGRLALYAEVSAAEPLLFAARRLLLELSGYLEAKGSGAERLRLTLLHREGRSTPIVVGLSSPGREPGRLLSLLRERLARTRIPEPVLEVALSAEEIVPLAPANGELWREPAQGRAESWSGLLERLRARLGEDAVRGVAPAAEHRPERAFVLTDPRRRSEREPPPGFGPRPLWLLPRPVPMEREGLTLLAGPERIESGWWDGDDVRRDYFVAEDPGGSRLWVFRTREGTRQWYLHGIFG